MGYTIIFESVLPAEAGLLTETLKTKEGQQVVLDYLKETGVVVPTEIQWNISRENKSKEKNF